MGDAMHRRQFLQGALLAPGLVWGWSDSEAAEASSITWRTDLRAAHTAAVEAQRPILIVFSAKWCTYCHKLLRETTADKQTSRFINERFIPTVLDFDKESRIAEVFEVESLPTTIVLSSGVDLLLQKSGYMKQDVFRKTLAAAIPEQVPIRQVNGVDRTRS